MWHISLCLNLDYNVFSLLLGYIGLCVNVGHLDILFGAVLNSWSFAYSFPGFPFSY